MEEELPELNESEEVVMEYVAFLVIKELSGLGYWYDLTVKGAMAYVCHNERISYQEKMLPWVRAKVRQALHV